MHIAKALSLLSLSAFSNAQIGDAVESVVDGATGAVESVVDGVADGANGVVNGVADTLAGIKDPNSEEVCSMISDQISDASQVVYPLAVVQYRRNIRHYMTSSTQRSECVVEVGSNEDAAIVMKLVGETRTPFAIKSGGHASNQGFSSTEGVLITLVRMKHLTISDDRSTVRVGMGNLWTEAYDKMDGSGLQLNGGRVSGPGTGGFTLGGGYSWFVNQYGLTCDTIESYTLITPAGEIKTVEESTPDLFFALKGGLNKFGLVTETVYKPFEQNYDVWGGLRIYGPNAVPALINATQKFYDDELDQKAQIILTLNTGFPPGAILLVLYDGPEPPAEVFADIDDIRPIVDGVKRQSYASFASSTPSNVQSGRRGAFHTLSTTALTIPFMNAAWNEAQEYSLFEDSGLLFSYDVEPFSKTYGRHATNSSYPHESSGLPLNLYFSWLNPADDEYWRGEMQASIDRLTQVAKDEGIFDPEMPAYPNYALGSYTAEQVYGVENAERLRTIRRSVDPDGIMGLTGGFEF